MSITTERQVIAECDVCGYWEASMCISQAEMKDMLRADGWSCGKTMKCPSCAGMRVIEDDTEVKNDG